MPFDSAEPDPHPERPAPEIWATIAVVVMTVGLWGGFLVMKVVDLLAGVK